MSEQGQKSEEQSEELPPGYGRWGKPTIAGGKLNPAIAKKIGLRLKDSRKSQRTKLTTQLYDGGENYKDKDLFTRYVVYCPTHEQQFFIDDAKTANALMSFSDSWCPRCRNIHKDF